MFSCKLKKWNKYTIKQDRNLVVTNMNIYNFNKKRKSWRRTSWSKIANHCESVSLFLIRNWQV